MFWTEWKESASFGDFIIEQFWDSLFSVDTFLNAWYAAIWPLYWLGQVG